MNIIIVIGIFIVVILLWRNQNNDKFISSHSDDSLILLWFKDVHSLDETGKVVNHDDEGHVINIQFIPIVGWKYNDKSQQYGYLTPITPPIYQVKDRLDNSKGYIRNTYWIRNGKEYEISSEWTSSGTDFLGDLSKWVSSSHEIKFHSNIPESMRTEVQKILKLKPLNK